jgi:type I restriction enzyme M protein
MFMSHYATEVCKCPVKKPNLKEGKEQLRSYCNATGAPIGIWTNGKSISYYLRKEPNYFEDLSGIPRADQKLSDILSERWKIDDLVKKDKLVNERKSLKDLIQEMEDEVLADAGVDVFEEVFKLIFIKLYDEMESGRKPDRNLEFRNYGDTEAELKDKLQTLFDQAKEKWPGVFADDDKILLTPSHLSVCVASLQDVKLFNSNLDVVDEAFEYLINKSSKGEKGQYFTPRYVIDMCVKMLNPKPDEKMIDTAAGSCGFPVHTIFYVWKNILESKGLKRSHLFTLEKKPAECTDYVQNNVFAIDFDEKVVRVARMLNLIAGDGQTNVLHLNTLDYERWDERVKDETWSDTYSEGWKKFKKMRVNQKSNRDFSFDIVMANPPFAGDIKESRILAKYDLSRTLSIKKVSKVPKGTKIIKKDPTLPDALLNGGSVVYEMSDGTFRKTELKQASDMSRDILFVERNIDFLKPGGRMAIVLPQGRFNNSSDKSLREYIASRCRILAVIGLHGNVFKPHTGTKTSVLFVQKWDDKLCPHKDDYNIFFATMQEPSKDKSGDKIYCTTVDKNGNTIPLLDLNGHLIVKHDLYNHEGLTHDGIAEAFIEFAKKEGLSFFAEAPLMK